MPFKRGINKVSYAWVQIVAPKVTFTGRTDRRGGFRELVLGNWVQKLGMPKNNSRKYDSSS